MPEQNASAIVWPFPRKDHCPLDPPPDYADRRLKCPVGRVSLWDGSRPWLVTRYRDARQVLAEPRLSSDTTRDGFPQASDTALAQRREQRSLPRLDPPQHTRHRRMLMKFFSVPQVDTLLPYFEDLATRLLDGMEESGAPCDLVKALARPMPANVICKLLDLPQEDSGFFQERVIAELNLDNTPEVATQAGADVLEYFGRLIEVRSTNPHDDIVSQLARDRLHTGELTRDELIHMLHLLVVGGFDTTANMIALGTITFLRHPDQLAEVRAQPDLIPQAVEELLRYLSVVHHAATRLALADFEFAGHQVRAGEGVIAPVPAANRDPEVFPDPDTFDIHRDARRHIAFGFGIHQCLGQTLARAELRVVFRLLFERFPTLRLSVTYDDLRFKNAMVYGVESLPVTWC